MKKLRYIIGENDIPFLAVNFLKKEENPITSVLCNPFWGRRKKN